MKYNKLNIPIITTNSGNNTNFIGIEYYKDNIFYNRFIGFNSRTKSRFGISLKQTYITDNNYDDL